jgi:hypothetical protein
MNEEQKHIEPNERKFYLNKKLTNNCVRKEIL